MSWSIRVIGNPANLQKELEAAGESMSAESRAEYEQAKPHLAALVGLNFSEKPTAIKLDASGQAVKKEGRKVYSTCQVLIESLARGWYDRLAV